MSAMSAESATSPQTKHTALSVAKTPTTHPHHATRKRTRSQQDEPEDAPVDDPPALAWTDDHERVFRRLCLDHSEEHRPGKEQDFWNMIQAKMTDHFGDTFRPIMSHPEVKDLDRMFREQSLSRSRQWLMSLDFFQQEVAKAEANGCRNGDGSVNGSRKKRKTDEPSKPDVPEVQVNGEKHEGERPNPVPHIPEVAFMRTKDQVEASKQFYESVLDLIRKNRLEEATSQDDVMTEFDEMFTQVNKYCYAFGPVHTIQWAIMYMVYCLVRDNRSRLLEVEEDLEKEQKKRKWNDDVLWSMINNKCSEVSIRATEQLEQVRNMMKMDTGSDFQQLRTDVVAAVTKYLRVQDDEMDTPPTPTPPRREGLRSKGRGKKDSPTANGRDAASTGSAGSRVAGFEAELDTALLAQQLKTLAAQREADAQTIEHQKLIILRMDQRLQDLESRVAGVA
jgi:hypothetical protein